MTVCPVAQAVDVGPTDTEPEPDPVINDETGDDFDVNEDEDEVTRQHDAVVEAYAHLFN
jgi:hypothetical protein